MPSLDEELQAYQEEQARQEELERQKTESRRRQQSAAQQLRQLAKQQVKAAAGKAAKTAAKKAGAQVARAAAVAIGDFLIAAAPVIGMILLIFALVLFVVVVIGYSCNAGGLTGAAAKTASSLIGLFGPDFCQYFSGISGGVTGAITEVGALLCRNPDELARQNNVPYPVKNDPDLDRLTSCITGRVGNVGSVFTYDQSHSICNYTRGVETCDQCSHSVNSCHYGGSSGSSGSLAVDFGGNPGAGQEGVIGPKILQAAITCSQSLGIPLKRATCENINEGAAVACSDPGANHVHISLGKCPSDNGPINSQ